MPTRATKRGAQRTPLTRDCDVLICGASFAGLTLARELEGAGAHRADRRPLRDRRAPNVGLRGADRVARAARPARLDPPDLRRAGRAHHLEHRPLAAAVQLLDLRLPRASAGCCATGRRRASSRPRPSRGSRPARSTSSTPTAASCARRSSSTRSAGGACSRTARRSSRRTRGSRAASRCTPTAPATTSRSGSIAATCARATAGASRPATSCGSAAARSSRATTSRTRPSRWPPTSTRPPSRFQGNWIPHKLRAATQDGVFFVGDSAGHCLPLTAEGIRPAFYFALALGRELRHVLAGRTTREQALERYGAFSAQHALDLRLAARRAAPGRAHDLERRAARRRARGRAAGDRPLGVPPLPGDRAAEFAQCRRINQVPATSSASPAMRVASSAW